MAITEIFPPIVSDVTFIELVVDVPDHPEGIVHRYDVAPLTGETEYVYPVTEHTFTLPVIAPGVDGVELTVTVRFWEGEEPQELFAVTNIDPPEFPTITEIVSAVEVPVHPLGNVHVYDVAPETGKIP